MLIMQDAFDFSVVNHNINFGFHVILYLKGKVMSIKIINKIY